MRCVPCAMHHILLLSGCPKDPPLLCCCCAPSSLRAEIPPLFLLQASLPEMLGLLSPDFSMAEAYTFDVPPHVRTGVDAVRLFASSAAKDGLMVFCDLNPLAPVRAQWPALALAWATLTAPAPACLRVGKHCSRAWVCGGALASLAWGAHHAFCVTRQSGPESSEMGPKTQILGKGMHVRPTAGAMCACSCSRALGLGLG